MVPAITIAPGVGEQRCDLTHPPDVLFCVRHG